MWGMCTRSVPSIPTPHMWRVHVTCAKERRRGPQHVASCVRCRRVTRSPFHPNLAACCNTCRKEWKQRGAGIPSCVQIYSVMWVSSGLGVCRTRFAGLSWRMALRMAITGRSRFVPPPVLCCVFREGLWYRMSMVSTLGAERVSVVMNGINAHANGVRCPILLYFHSDHLCFAAAIQISRRCVRMRSRTLKVCPRYQ